MSGSFPAFDVRHAHPDFVLPILNKYSIQYIVAPASASSSHATSSTHAEGKGLATGIVSSTCVQHKKQEKLKDQSYHYYRIKEVEKTIH